MLSSSLGRLRLFAALILGLIASMPASAGGPRFVTGTSGWWVGAGTPVTFNTTTPTYFTDPGTLSTAITHAQSDSIVSAAAQVWNSPYASLTLSQGGTLAEHVSSANSYFNGSAMVFPADVESSNAASIPIAVIYDTDGSITDLLLGSGASSPSSCRQNGVTESVDAFSPAGTITHALLVLNGRCLGTGSALQPSMQQLQYQAMRAFGRILGLAWAQVNDAVFTGASALNASMIDNWPIMHPLDVICGTYTYQCMANVFALRPDDISSLAFLYPVATSGQPSGKTATSLNAVHAKGQLYFPTGQGMSMVNVVVRKQTYGATDVFEVNAAVSGNSYFQNLGNPVTGPETQMENAGGSYGPAEGIWEIERIPEDQSSNLWMTTTPINPLYVGDLTIGPYERPALTLSGSSQVFIDWVAGPGTSAGFVNVIPDAASSCSTGNDGSESSPATFDPSGWQSDLFCGLQHSAWFNIPVKAGHTWTLEAKALDDSGAATTQKAQPLIGVWQSTDATGQLPTVAAQAAPMNALALGVTQLRPGAPSADTTFRVAFTEEFGVGRPDYFYTARVLYADSISPASTGYGGGQITLTGTGFVQGNQVKINSVAATVLSWTANSIVLDVPTAAAAHATVGTPVSVTVLDSTTGGSSTIPAAFTYTAAPDTIVEVSAPSLVITGSSSTPPFSARVMTSDGLLAVAGAQVRLSLASASGSARFDACNASSCLLTADSNGLVQSTVTGLAAGNLTLVATEVTGGAAVSVNVPEVDPVRTVSHNQSTAWIATGAAGAWTITLNAQQNGSPGVSAPVSWTASNGLILNPLTAAADLLGNATLQLSTAAFPSGTVTVTGCAWVSSCATWTLHGVDSPLWTVGVASGAGQQIAATATFTPVTLAITDGSAHPLQLAPVTVFQRVEAYVSCPETGRCPASPTLATNQAATTSDANGLVSVTPLTSGSGAQIVNLTAATGDNGALSLTLVRNP